MKRMAGLDRYTLQARLAPALLVGFPIGLAMFVWFPDGGPISAAVLSLVTWAGGTALLAQLGRDAGKRKEPGLYARWGGKPTVRLLRHRDAPNAIVLARRHEKLKQLLKVAEFPSPREEAADAGAADAVYEAGGMILREKTRDQAEFPLVFAENCNYGFRRNLWGMKPYGIAIDVMALAAIATAPLIYGGGRLGVAVLAGGATLAMLVCFLWIVTPAWVRTAAEAYAERLLEAAERL